MPTYQAEGEEARIMSAATAQAAAVKAEAGRLELDARENAKLIAQDAWKVLEDAEEYDHEERMVQTLFRPGRHLL